MKKVLKLSFLAFLVFLFLTGCQPNNNEQKDIFKYQGSYVGDNSAVGNIIMGLPGGEYLEEFALKTGEEPYGITIKYNWMPSEKFRRETAVNNATYLFALIRNADWVTYNFRNQEYKIAKEELQKWYGKDLSTYKNENGLKALIKEFTEDENKMNEFFLE